MEAYTGFAEVYDLFMDNVPYEEWSKYLIGLLREFGAEQGIVLELGCGTGKMTRLLAQAGYDMIGIDNSQEMLQVARESTQDPNILYLLQDMREFELYGTVRAVVGICDSMNYLTQYEDLVQTLKLVNNYLDPKGVFIFDLNTLYKYKELIGDSTIAESREECCFIWENEFDEESRINEYDLSLFVRKEGNLYQRFEETHYQRAYTIEEICRAVSEAGMELEAVYEAFTRDKPERDSERIYVVAREKGKSKVE